MRRCFQAPRVNRSRIFTDGEAEEDDLESWTERLSMTMLETIDGSVGFFRDLGDNFRSWLDAIYDGVREEDQFQHSAWVLAAMGTSFVLLVYFGVGLSSLISRHIDKSYLPRRDCTVMSAENNGQLGDFIFRLAGFAETPRELSTGSVDADVLGDTTLTDAACNINLANIAGQDPSGIVSSDQATDAQSQLLAAQSQISEAFVGVESATLDEIAASNISTAAGNSRLYRCSTQDYSSNSCLALALVNQVETDTATELGEIKTPTEVFNDHAIGRTIYVIDRVIRHLKWAIWIGLTAGMLVGVLSLLSILVQYKRFSLAIRSGFFTDLPISKNLALIKDTEKNLQRVQSIVNERRWRKLIEHYPMGASVFFFGILVSTAVIQLFVFGSAVAIGSAFIASMFDSRVLDILRPYVALLIAVILAWLLNGPLAQRVISEGILVRRYRVHHEFGFLLFMLIYTAVHLVLGVFFALMRLAWVLITTTATLNRLDRNLFPILQGNDLGHKSFMSMVLTQHAFLSNADSGEQFLISDLLDMIERQRRGREEGPSASPAFNPTGPADVSPDTSTKKESAPRGTQRKTVSFYLKEDVDSIGGGAAYLRPDFGIGEQQNPLGHTVGPREQQGSTRHEITVEQTPVAPRNQEGDTGEAPKKVPRE